MSMAGVPFSTLGFKTNLKLAWMSYSQLHLALKLCILYPVLQKEYHEMKYNWSSDFTIIILHSSCVSQHICGILGTLEQIFRFWLSRLLH